jgi:RNA polymerase sigma-B factor
MSSSDDLNDELFREYIATGDISIRNQIVSNNLFLAQVLSRKFLGRGTEYDDLLQIASLALIKAVERYDLGFETKFITFATPTIIGELKKYFRDKVPLIKLPRRIHEIKSKIGLIRNELQLQLGRVPSANDIAEHLGLPLETVLESMEVDYNSMTSSMDAGGFTDEDIDFHETLGEDDTNFAVFENSNLVDRILVELDDFEKEFVNMRFFNEMTQAQMAQKLNVSQMYVSRLEKKVINKIRRFMDL